MKLNSSRTSLTKLKRYARSFTVAVSTWCLVCSPCSASADPDYSQDLHDLKVTLQLINNQLGNIYNPLGPPVAQQQYDGRMDFLFQLLGYGQTVSPDRNILVDLEKILKKPTATDILAGNPWWATNSDFALAWYEWGDRVPRPHGDNMWSFPDFMSALASFRTRTSYSRSDFFNRAFGFGTENHESSFYDTFEDWIADAMRSNLVLASFLGGTTAGPSNALPGVSSAVDDGSTSGTNGVPEMVVEQMHVTGIEDGLDLVDPDAVRDMFPESSGGANPEFVVFSGGRYGAVTVPEVRGSLAIPDNVALYLTGAATWLWRVALFVGCFVILRQEVAFWSTLGGSTSDA